MQKYKKPVDKKSIVYAIATVVVVLILVFLGFRQRPYIPAQSYTKSLNSLLELQAHCTFNGAGTMPKRSMLEEYIKKYADFVDGQPVSDIDIEAIIANNSPVSHTMGYNVTLTDDMTGVKEYDQYYFEFSDLLNSFSHLPIEKFTTYNDYDIYCIVEEINSENKDTIKYTDNPYRAVFNKQNEEVDTTDYHYYSISYFVDRTFLQATVGFYVSDEYYNTEEANKALEDSRKDVEKLIYSCIDHIK